ncbi:MAG: thioredoxin family protein [Acidobacteriota bacterium]|jgi:protein disulfide-isomerase
MARRTDREERARQEIAAAVERAAEAGKRVLVIFGADWCVDSGALKRTFRHALLLPLLADGFEVIHLDVGDREHYRETAGGWGIDYAAGLPAAAVLDAEGELVTSTTAGELASARTMTPIEIATLIHRWMPGSPHD